MGHSVFAVFMVFGLCCVLVTNQAFGASEQPYRTSYHFQSPKNWLNDPNGPMYYNGLYHLFYQYNPNGPLFGKTMVWAHSVSTDLINWAHLDHALEPTGPFDAESCYSGSVTIHPKTGPIIIYTGKDSNSVQVQNLAMPEDPQDPFLIKWTKFPQNPIMVPPEGIDGGDFRDPTSPWQGQDGKWRVIVGSFKDGHGLAFLYHSDDFLNWTKVPKTLYSAPTPGKWECPDFSPVGLRGTRGVDTSAYGGNVTHVLKASYADIAQDIYQLGTYDSKLESFVPDLDSPPMRFDYGKFYASKTFFDSSTSRRIVWGWVNESDSFQNAIEKGWFGIQAIPRTIWLDQRGKQLIQWPVEEVKTLRDNQVTLNGQKLKSGSVFEVVGVTASQADVDVLFEVPDLEEAEVMDPTWHDPEMLCNDKNAEISGSVGPFGLLVLASDDLTELTAIFFRIFRGRNGYVVLMCSDQSRSSMRNGLDKRIFGGFVDIDPQLEKISLRSLIDHSVVESLGGQGKTCITARVYPKLAIDEETHLYVFNNGTKDVIVSRLSAWSMKKAQLRERDHGLGFEVSESKLGGVSNYDEL